MLKGAVARRYAEAMFDLARKYDTLDPTGKDLQEIAQVFANRKISYLLREPKIPARRKEDALRAALKGRVKDMSLNLALLLVQRELVEYMVNISAAYDQLMLDYRNEAIADVTTATEVNPVQRLEIERALAERTGKTIIMKPHVDPSILVGVISVVLYFIIVGSVRYRLNLLEQQLMNNVSSSTTQFFSQQELDETARAISTVDTNTDTTTDTNRDTTSSAATEDTTQTTETTQQAEDAHDTSDASNADANKQAQDSYDVVPDSKSSASRS